MASKEYWFNRVDNLPDAPKLPLSNLQKDIQYPFIRRKFSLSSERWQQFQQVAAKLSITPAALLMTAYGQTIKTWSDSSHFTLNLMFFNRPPIHSDINNIIGNFSTTLLLEMNMHDVLTFAERAKLVQKQLISDLEHSEFNGIKVLNEINRRKGGSSLAAMPVVFACALNLRPIDSSQKNFFKWYGNQVSYSHLETPQVWLDHQVFEDDDGSLCCIWDARDGYFPDGLINTMFESYEKLLQTISIGAININNLSIIPDEDLNLIHLINDTKAERSKELLHFGIIQYAMRTPNKVAIITQDLSITYQQLIATAGEIKQDLINLGVRHNDLVSIVMEKGWEQIASAIAILSAGAVYIPIDASLPESRIKQIINTSNCKIVVVQHRLSFECKLPQLSITTVNSSITLDDFDFTPLQDVSDLAYIIFTSGSTGIPKGVMISHQAAMNTVKQITEKYNVTSDDVAFAISSFSFDLSIYDTFGLLNAGGTLYIPTGLEVKNPEAWVKIIGHQNITIWNSAPALMQIFIEAVGINNGISAKLKTVLLSGDWIPTWLPAQIKRYFHARVVSLGGATEASIWSNYYDIDNIDASWSSIPYGKPLANQNMYVLDDNLDCRAIWASGLIYIGGEGLSNGYLNDTKKTNESFILHPRWNTRLYCTGDIGRLHPDGNIEFLGRQDLQVKVQGYRIELGDIEAALSEQSEIKQVIVRAIGEKSEAKKIVAFFTTEQQVDLETIKNGLASKIPGYMMPNYFSQVESFPLTANGKINLNQLVNSLELSAKEIKNHEAPVNETELKIANIWSKLLNINNLSRHDNFFDVGGTSFTAFQMVHQIKKEFGYSLSLTTIFQKGTIFAIAEDLNCREDAAILSLVTLQQNGNKPPIFFIHPSGGGVLCYTELIKTLGYDRPFYGLQHPCYINGSNSNTITKLEALAANYLNEILDKCPDGDCWIGGWSFGGVVAFEIAKQLKDKGITPKPLLLIDSPAPMFHKIPDDEVIYKWFKDDYGIHYSSLDIATKNVLFSVFKSNIQILSNYAPEISCVDIVQLKAKNITFEQLKIHDYNQLDDWGWGMVSTGNINCFNFNANHTSIIQYPNLYELSQKISQIVSEVG